MYKLQDGNIGICHRNKKDMALAMYLYCVYNDITIDKSAFRNNVRHKERRNEMIEDCRKENLYLGGSSIYLDEAGESIIAVSNTGKFTDTFDYVPIIADILNGCKSLQTRKSDRVMANFKGELFPVGDLAYLAYYDKDLTVDNFIEKRQALRKYKEDNKLNLEHLDGDFHNHRKYNIALVKELFNSQKNDKISRIIEPYCFTVVYDKPYYSGVKNGGKFKILTGVFGDDLMLTVEKRFITDCFENVVNLLDIYIAEYPERIDKERALQENERLIFDVRFSKLLAKEPTEHFTCLDFLA